MYETKYVKNVRILKIFTHKLDVKNLDNPTARTFE